MLGDRANFVGVHPSHENLTKEELSHELMEMEEQLNFYMPMFLCTVVLLVCLIGYIVVLILPQRRRAKLRELLRTRQREDSAFSPETGGSTGSVGSASDLRSREMASSTVSSAASNAVQPKQVNNDNGDNFILMRSDHNRAENTPPEQQRSEEGHQSLRKTSVDEIDDARGPPPERQTSVFTIGGKGDGDFVLSPEFKNYYGDLSELERRPPQMQKQQQPRRRSHSSSSETLRSEEVIATVHSFSSRSPSMFSESEPEPEPEPEPEASRQQGPGEVPSLFLKKEIV